MFASLIGTASYVQAPKQTGYGFESSIVVAGLCLLPSGLLMLLLAPVAARLIASIGGHRTLAIGAIIVAAGWLLRIVATGSIWYVVLGSTIVGAGTGIGYAAMPALINRNSPPSELAAANGLNSLSRSLGSSLASAIGGSLLTVSTVTVAGFALAVPHRLPSAVRDLRRRRGERGGDRAVHPAPRPGGLRTLRLLCAASHPGDQLSASGSAASVATAAGSAELLDGPRYRALREATSATQSRKAAAIPMIR